MEENYQSADLEVGQKYRLPVDKEKCTRDYYVVYTSDMQFRINKLKFQRKESVIPDELQCIVKDIKNDVPVIGQDIAPIIERFYKKNEEATFRVKNDYTTKSGYYEIEDDRGLFFRLYERSRLFVGQSIKCKVTGIKGIQLYLKLSSQKARVNFLTRYISFDDLLKRIDRDKDDKIVRRVKAFLYRRPELATARQEHDDKVPSWIFTAIQSINNNIDLYLKHDDLYRDHIIPALELNKEISLYILERSDFLRQFDERAGLQKLLSDNIQNIKHYLNALNLILEHKEDKFLSDMLLSLRKSGYIYHPNKQFRIMMTIFKIKPSLVTKHMGNIFNALRDWNIDNWRNEPFRSAFVEQLEMFITATRHSIDEMQGIENVNDNQLFSQMVKAIAVQTLIATDSDNIDIDRNRSMLYRYLTLSDRAGRENLLYKSLFCIIDNGRFPIEYNWNDTQQEIVVKSKAAADSTMQSLTIDPNIVKTYHGSRCKISLSDQGITLKPASTSADTSVLPNKLINWPQINVLLPGGINTPNARQTNNLQALQKMWADIERNLFAEPVVRPVITKQLPEVGDIVKIFIDDIDHFDSKIRLHCVVEDEYYKGEGWLNVKDIVKYSVTPDISDFCDENSCPYIYEAKVLGRSNTDELSFTMNDTVNQVFTSEIGFGEETTCVITDIHHDRWSAISCDGYSLWIERTPDSPTLNIKDFVKVSITSVLSMDRIIGELTGDNVWPDDYFKESEPFTNLMTWLPYDTLGNNDSADEDTMLEEEIISRQQISEIVQLLRRVAVGGEEYIASYNLLAVARLCSLAIEDTDMAETLDVQMKLLQLLKTYADTNRIKAEDLHKFKALAQPDTQPILYRLYTKLDIITRLNDHSTESMKMLWSRTTSPRNETEGKLAQLVLSHNMLDESLFASERNAITQQIRRLLNINTTDTSAKYYGSETQTVEFKTSLIYPAGNSMRPDPKVQTAEIMKEICGMLNQSGGTLYLGVNDSGYAAGLEYDLKYDLFKNSTDRYNVYLDNSIDQFLGKTARQYIEINPDDDTAGRYVLKISIGSCPHIIECDKKVFIRQGTSVRELTGEDLDIFREDRANQLKLQKEVDKSNSTAQAAATQVATSQVETFSQPALSSATTTASTISKAIETEISTPSAPVNDNPILTSLTRNNVLHDYEDDFIEPLSYIYFRDGNNYMRSENGYLDQDVDCRLALAIHDEERNGSLIIVYDDMCAVKVPMRELLDKTIDKKYHHCKDKNIKWASPAASEDDYLLTIATDSNNNIYYRVDPISNIANGNINSPGDPITFSTVSHIILCEIIPADMVSLFEKGLKTTERQIGYPLKARLGTTLADSAIHNLLSPLKNR